VSGRAPGRRNGIVLRSRGAAATPPYLQWSFQQGVAAMKATFRDIRRESCPRLQQPTDRADPMKLLLIATTALVCVASLATAGTLPERQAGSGHSALDANGEFLCNYGFKLHAASDDSFLFWNRAATPVIGKGTAVNEIIVEDGPSGGSGPNGFQVAIYTSHRGKPKTELGHASATQPGCGRVRVPISPITLEYGKKYWIVQSALTSYSASNSIVWLYDTKRTHGALSQSVSTGPGSSHMGPWVPITGGVPYARVRESTGASKLNRPPQSQGASVGAISQVTVPTRRGGHEGNIARYPP
jgi:hypothetical protein